jgi:bifunctional oligoribonuclease and PAP phosphatase NrnA
MQNILGFQELLKTPQNVVLIPHYKPDADAMGSCLALSGILHKLGHSTTVICPSDYPDFLSWMQGSLEVLVYEKGKTDFACNKLLNKAGLIFCMDFSALSRTHDLQQSLSSTSAVMVMIDHHINPENFAQYVLHNDKAASTCELVYELIEKLHLKHLIDQHIAACIYAGIMADTGSFRHPNTNIKVHQIAAELIGNGLNTNKIHRYLYDSYSLDRLKFLGFMLSQKLKLLPELNVAYFTVSNDELKQYNSQTGDTEGVVNYALSIKNIAVGILIVERADAVKFSFRSVEEIAINDIASSHFNGGGHRNAAGGQLNGYSLAAAEQKLLDVLPLYKDRLTGIS